MKKQTNIAQESNTVVIICPRCKGKKVVFDPISLLLTVGLPIALFLDAGGNDGITKMDCPTCNASGVLKLDI